MVTQTTIVKMTRKKITKTTTTIIIIILIIIIIIMVGLMKEWSTEGAEVQGGAWRQ